MTKAEFDSRIAELYKDNVDTSPDFQCDQTGGFPTSLCVNWDKGKAWLELNQAMINDGDDVSPYEQMCADYGIRDCVSHEEYNGLLEGLGEDAVTSAYLIDDMNLY